MQYESNDHQNPSPRVDHIPGGAGKQEHRVYHAAPAGYVQEIHAAQGGEQETERYGDVQDQVPTPACVHAAAPAV